MLSTSPIAQGCYTQFYDLAVDDRQMVVDWTLFEAYFGEPVNERYTDENPTDCSRKCRHRPTPSSHRLRHRHRRVSSCRYRADTQSPNPRMGGWQHFLVFGHSVSSSCREY